MAEETDKQLEGLRQALRKRKQEMVEELRRKAAQIKA